MSKETKFTKGEWKADFYGMEGGFLYNGESIELKTGIDTITISGRGFNNTLSSEQTANAHLIKTAPKLYAILEDLSRLMVVLDKQTHPNIELDAVKHDIDTLLAEARGE